MNRVSVIGSSGSGKTTAAEAIADALDVPRLELDSVMHQPGWVPLDDVEFRARVEEFTRQDRWVVDGNYTSHGVADIVWPRADTIVWLDLPRHVVMRQVTSRTLRRVIRSEELWNGNRERWSNLLSRRPEDNIVLWAWTRHRPTRAKYERHLAGETWTHAAVYRLRGRSDLEALLAGLSSAGQPGPG